MDQRLITALRVVVGGNQLNINQSQKKMVVDEKGVGVYPMDPFDFLKLATGSLSEINVIKLQAKPLDFYNSPEAESIIHPFLAFDAKDGKIRSHEGRHRAAAVMEAGGTVFWIALYPYAENGSKHREWEKSDIPTFLKNSPYKFPLDHDKIEWEDFNLAD